MDAAQAQYRALSDDVRESRASPIRRGRRGYKGVKGVQSAQVCALVCVCVRACALQVHYKCLEGRARWVQVCTKLLLK